MHYNVILDKIKNYLICFPYILEYSSKLLAIVRDFSENNERICKYQLLLNETNVVNDILNGKLRFVDAKNALYDV